MNQSDTRSSGPDSPLPGGAADDHLPTTRLPPVSAPPVRSRSVRPGSLSPAGALPDLDPARPQSLPYRRSSRLAPWGESLFAFLFRRQADRQAMATPPLDERIVRQRAGFATVAIGLALAVLGVALGLRGAPSTPLAPVVTASLILARALAGLGTLALGLTVVRLGDRLLRSDNSDKG